MSKRDYYEILGIKKDASKLEIREAYKKLAKKYHPDINKDHGAEENFKEISEAYAVLSDDNKRAQYNQFGHQSFDQRFSKEDIFRGFDFDIFDDFGFDDSDSLFNMFFGGSRRSHSRRGADLVYDLEIEFEEAAFGSKKEIRIPITKICESCEGNGAKNGTEFEKCKSCNGKGKVEKIQRTLFGAFKIVTTCSSCRGSGEIIKTKCPDCKGEGKITQKKDISLKIPAGVDDDSKIRIVGAGEAGERDAEPGDLYILIHVRPHKLFKRTEDDIHLELPIAFSQLALGCKINIPTLDGKLKLKIPAGTQTHTIFRLKNKGIAHLNRHGTGDEFVKVIIETPRNINKKQKEILKELLQQDI